MIDEPLMIDCFPLDCESICSAIFIAKKDILLLQFVILFFQLYDFLLLFGDVDIILKYFDLFSEYFEAFIDLLFVFGFAQIVFESLLLLLDVLFVHIFCDPLLLNSLSFDGIQVFQYLIIV
jgi:hypothetical protein